MTPNRAPEAPARRVRVNITIDPTLLARVREQAADRDRSFSSQVERALRTYFEMVDGDEIDD